jgi:WD repeat-containing protein 23
MSAVTEAATDAIDALTGEGDDDDEDWTDDDEYSSFAYSDGGGRRARGEDSSMKKIKTVQGEEGRWTITDCDSTRDGSRMIYSSITPYVHMLHTAEFEAEHTCLDFTGQRRRGHGYDGWGYDGFGVSACVHSSVDYRLAS